MTQEDKDLLLKDLCARLPYGVKFKHEHISEVCKILSITPIYDYVVYYDRYINEPKKCYINDVKPYLFPMSQVVEEIVTTSNKHIAVNVDFFHKNHIDYRGLIPKGLANDATGLNIY